MARTDLLLCYRQYFVLHGRCGQHKAQFLTLYHIYCAFYDYHQGEKHKKGRPWQSTLQNKFLPWQFIFR